MSKFKSIIEIYNIKVGEAAYFVNNGIDKSVIREIWHREKHEGKGIDGEDKEFRELIEVLFEGVPNCSFPFERVGVSLQELKNKLLLWEGIPDNTTPTLETIEGCKLLAIEKFFNDFEKYNRK